MPTRIALRCAVLAVALAITPVVGAQTRYEGLAYPAKGGALIYRETHWIHRDGGVDSRVVLYRCPDGRPFARKTMRDVPSALAPDFDFLDARTGYREGVRTRNGAREVFHREDARSRLQSRVLHGPGGVVIDAGFDHYVRRHWDRLARAGVTAAFLVPSRFEAMDFRIGNAVDATERGRPVRRLRMTLSGLLGLAVPAIELTYDATDRRLLRFRGPGTVRDARGRLQVLRVEFPDAPVRSGVPRAEIDAATAAPLVTSCGA